MEEKEKKEERKIAINFENFTFKYESQSKPTLHNINLKIYEGEKIVIVGPSGSGKKYDWALYKWTCSVFLQGRSFWKA